MFCSVLMGVFREALIISHLQEPGVAWQEKSLANLHTRNYTHTQLGPALVEQELVTQEVWGRCMHRSVAVEVERLNSGALWTPEEECDVTEALLLPESVDFAKDGVTVGGETKP